MPRNTTMKKNISHYGMCPFEPNNSFLTSLQKKYLFATELPETPYHPLNIL